MAEPSALWVLCRHGMTRKHWWPAPHEDENCPGGHSPTVEEVTEWLVERDGGNPMRPLVTLDPTALEQRSENG